MLDIIRERDIKTANRLENWMQDEEVDSDAAEQDLDYQNDKDEQVFNPKQSNIYMDILSVNNQESTFELLWYEYINVYNKMYAVRFW